MSWDKVTFKTGDDGGLYRTVEPVTDEKLKRELDQAGHEGYVHRDLVADDQAINVLTGGLPDETISSRVRRISDAHPRWGWNPGVWLAKGVNAFCNLFQKDHGAKAEAGDLERAERVKQTEQQALGIGAKRRRIG